VLFLYSVAYRVDLSAKVVHRTVIASDTDDARAKVRAVDPRFLATVKSPRRGRPVIELETA
jgi:hypothetical protein